MAGLKLERYPNNEIRFTVLHHWQETRAPQEERPSFLCQLEVNPSTDSIDEECGERQQPPFPPLDITSELETASLAPGFGGLPRPTEFGVVGRRKLIRAGAALTKHSESPNEVVFLTGTLPGSTVEAFEVIARYSSFVVHRLKAWIAKRCPAKLDMYCWEWQKRGALHLHYAVHCPNPSARQDIISNFKSQWIRLMDAISEASGIDVWRKNDSHTHATNKEVVQADARECTKDIGRYLSKYISKQQTNHKSKHFFPTRWWSISRPLNALLASMSEVITIPFTFGRRFRATVEDCNQFLDSQEAVVQRYSCEQFADVAVVYTKPEEHDGIFTCMKNLILKSSPARNQSSPGTTTPEYIKSLTEKMLISLHECYSLMDRSQVYSTYLHEFLSSAEITCLSSLLTSPPPTYRNLLVLWSRLSCVYAARGTALPPTVRFSKQMRRMDNIAAAMLKEWPRGLGFPQRYGPPNESYPPKPLNDKDLLKTP